MTGAPGDVIGGRFRLDTLVGQGGMGRVWRGHDVVLDRAIAVKEILLPPHLPAGDRADMVARTTREARAAARLNHPGVVTIHDVIEHDGGPWIVMEYVTGMSLGAELANQGRLPWRWAAEIGGKIADALAYAHAAGIVHRDLKPENVLLAGDRVVVTDFGIARVLDETGRLTGTGTVVGTPHYLAPEQLEGGPVEAAADIWSLGATLYRAVEGRPPFGGETLGAVMAGVFARDPEPPAHAGPLTPLLSQMLTKDPGHRPDARAVARALAARYSQAAADGERPPVTPLDLVAAAPEHGTVTVGSGAAATGTHPPRQSPGSQRSFPALGTLAASWRGRSRVLASCVAVVAVLIGAGTYYLVSSSQAVGGDPRATGRPGVSADKSPAAHPRASAAKSLTAARPIVSATHKAAPPPPIGDACLVGTWLDGQSETSTTYDGASVVLHTSGGDVDHIFASGIDENTWGPETAPFYGTYQGQTLKVIEYGEVRTTIRATPRNHHLSVTNDGWSANSVITYYYAGGQTVGQFGASGGVAYRTYRCTSGTLTWLDNGKVNDTETRVSRTP
jgi:hypothetical protein